MRIPSIIKTEWNNIINYEDRNCLQIKIKRKGRDKKFEYFFSDYSQVQTISDKTITYSSGMIDLFILMEIIISSQEKKSKGTDSH